MISNDVIFISDEKKLGKFLQLIFTNEVDRKFNVYIPVFYIDFFFIFKNEIDYGLYTERKILLRGLKFSRSENNFVGILKIMSNAAKDFDILATLIF